MKRLKTWKSFILNESVDILPVGTKIIFCGKYCEIVSHKSTHHNDIYYLVRYRDGQEEFIVPVDKRIEVVK